MFTINDNDIKHKLQSIEIFAKDFLILHRGYRNQPGSLPKNCLRRQALLSLFFTIYTLRCFCLVLTTNEKISLFLGDAYHGLKFSWHLNVLNFLICVIIQGAYSFSSWLDITGRTKWLNILETIKILGVQHRALKINPVHCKKLRSYLSFALLWVRIGPAGAWFIGMTMNSYFIFTNHAKDYGLLFAMQMVWLFIQAIFVAYLTTAAAIFFCSGLIILIHMHYQLIALATLVTRNSTVSRKNVEKFIKHQGRQILDLDCLSYDIRFVLYFFFTFTAFTGDFAFFCTILNPTELKLFQLLFLVAGFQIFFAIVMIGFYCAQVKNKILRLSQRIASNNIGLTAGDSYLIDNEYVLIFILENISMLMLLIANLSY